MIGIVYEAICLTLCETGIIILYRWRNWSLEADVNDWAKSLLIVECRGGIQI